VTSPSLFLADEPTGNLDSRTSVQILTILRELNVRGLTIVLVTHEAEIASYAHRQVKFRDGRIVDDTAPVNMVTASTEIVGRLQHLWALFSDFTLLYALLAWILSWH
jgi:ABC-type lipoprotein export system ATPase subunit